MKLTFLYLAMSVGIESLKRGHSSSTSSLIPFPRVGRSASTTADRIKQRLQRSGAGHTSTLVPFPRVGRMSKSSLVPFPRVGKSSKSSLVPFPRVGKSLQEQLLSLPEGILPKLGISRKKFCWLRFFTMRGCGFGHLMGIAWSIMT